MLIYRKFSIIFKYFLFIYMFIQTYYLYSSRTSAIALLFFLITSLIINDYLRSIKICINSKYIYASSLLVTIFISSSLNYFIEGLGTYFYLIYPLEEILSFKGVIKKPLFSIHLLLYIVLVIDDIGVSNTSNILSLLLPILIYFFMASTIYSLIMIKKEKEEINKLNLKLQLTNIKLKQYTLEVEKLTAYKERNIVSQRFHDSIGHSLMALIMHLEFAEKMYNKKPKEVKEILLKSHEIAKSSINSLREAVDLLNKKPVIKPFNDSIKDIIDTFCIINNIKINFDINKNLDSLNLIIKNSIYSTINEFITNSIKHGHPTEINIKISIENYIIHLILTNNDIGCNTFIKSNELHGIENRITTLNGSVNYFNNKHLGIGIHISIPIFIDETY